jgi:glyoxylase-like metal-dependent hydrolase (beta-lactamase superfamily II)
VKSRKIGGVPYKLVEWSPSQKAPSGKPYRIIGYINPQHMVDRVETWVEHPLMGDLNVVTTYSDFRDVDGLKVPLHISQQLAGMETFVVAITRARANPPNLAELMRASPIPVPPPPAPLASERLADGVYRLTGGYVSLAVEFKDHVVVLEGGQHEARGLAVIAETKRLFPTKRIKYVVNTHPHFDHAGGLPPFVAEGATIITDDNSKFWVGASMSEPRTLLGDVLAKSGKKPKVEGVIDTLVLKDDTRSVELYHVEGLQHSDAMLIAYLPKERILFSADFNPPRPGQPASPSIAILIENLDRLKLDFDRHVTVHAPNPDRPLTRTDLYEWAKATPQP